MDLIYSIKNSLRSGFIQAGSMLKKSDNFENPYGLEELPEGLSFIKKYTDNSLTVSWISQVEPWDNAGINSLREGRFNSPLFQGMRQDIYDEKFRIDLRLIDIVKASGGDPAHIDIGDVRMPGTEGYDRDGGGYYIGGMKSLQTYIGGHQDPHMLDALTEKLPETRPLIAYRKVLDLIGADLSLADNADPRIERISFRQLYT